MTTEGQTTPIPDPAVRRALRRFWWANGALLLLGLLFVGVGVTVLISNAKTSNDASTPERRGSSTSKAVGGDLLVACGVVSAMFVLQNAMLAAFHTGLPFSRHVELRPTTF